MAAANTDKFKKLARRWVGSIGSGGVADESVTTIPLSSTTDLPTDTAVVAVIDRVDANGTATPSLEESVIGVVSGDNLVDCVRGAEGTAQAHSAGAVVEILVTAKGWNDLIDALLVGHAQSGAHTSEVVNTLKASGSEVDTGTNDAKIVTPKAIADSKVLRANEAWDGWIEAGETWTYASATTFTISGDKTGKYQKGDKIKLTQTTAKYFYIIGVSYSEPNTTITVTGGSDYSLASATITDNYYSKAENPQGFPDWFSWTPTLAAGGSMTYTSTAVYAAKFSIKGKQVSFYLNCGGTTGGTASNFISFTLPVANAVDGNKWGNGAIVYDGGFRSGFVHVTSSSEMRVYKYDASNYGLGTNRQIIVSGVYEMA